MGTNKKDNFVKNNLLAFMMLIVSTFTLVMYVRQTNLLTRQTDILIEQNKASTWPYLYIGRSMSMVGDSVSAYSIVITNQGNGPAIVEKAVLKLDGVEVETWPELYRQMQVPEHVRAFQNNNILRNKVIMPGEELVLVDWSRNPILLKYIYSKFYNLELEICYRSVLKDYWTVKCSSFDEARYYDDGIISHQDGCRLNAKKYFKQ